MEPYKKGCSTRPHTDPPWRWRNGYYELADSDRSDCVCAQYAVYKLTGRAGTAPTPDVDADPASPSVIQWLLDNGYRASDPVPAAKETPDHCGCREDRQSNCAVVYRNTEDHAMIHIAVFDPQFCDWGGKLTGRGKIVRFAEPGDYARYFGDGDVSKVEMVFYCKGEAAPYVSDEAITAGLNGRLGGGKTVPRALWFGGLLLLGIVVTWWILRR